MRYALALIDRIASPVFHDGHELPGVDAVKFQKRDLSEEMTRSMYNSPYSNKHSFGRTYGQHREALELTDTQHAELYDYAKSKGLDFIETICAVGALSLLDLFTPDYIKIASRDLDNLPLLKAVAETRIPVILSTGMAGKQEILDAVWQIEQVHQRISVLHCVSAYPTWYNEANLRRIVSLAGVLPYPIGYSDHTTGILAGPLSVMLGAEIIEKHVTLDRQMKGSDHEGSLGEDGLYRFVRDVRNAEIALGTGEIDPPRSVAQFARKLRRSIASMRGIRKGETITREMVHLLSPGDGVRWADREAVIGKQATGDIAADELILPGMVE